jgi:hypothetical protein
MGYVPYVGFATCSRATVMTHFVCCIKKIKKKNGVIIANGIEVVSSRVIRKGGKAEV